ncbi:protein kinase, ATP binding site-containing protein [Tanacetum coccineum]
MHCFEEVSIAAVSSLSADKTAQLPSNTIGRKVIDSQKRSLNYCPDHLQDPDKRLSLTWPQRLTICIGAAKSLNYLHSGLGEDCSVIHRNVNSHTILLDEKLEAKLSDFSNAIKVGGNQEHIYEEASGSRYYMDPIYLESGFHKIESDVYSLGVVMFELLSGTPTNHRRDIGYGEPQPLINLARIYHDDGLDNIIDPYIKDIIDKRSLRTFKRNCIQMH